LAVGLALKRGPEFRKKMQNAQKALQKLDVQFDSFLRHAPKTS
jgi:RpiR family carbohydrate utilization transcriptional regulator